MGMDLRLLPFDGDSRLSFSHTILDCERRRELWDPIFEIEKKVGRDVPEDFSSFSSRETEWEDNAYGKTTRTPYGEKLKYILVSDLLPLATDEAVTDNEKNRAIWAYLACLRPDTKVALYWH